MTEVGTEESSSEAVEVEQDPSDPDSGIAWTSEGAEEDLESPFGALAGALATKAKEEAEQDTADSVDSAEEAGEPSEQDAEAVAESKSEMTEDKAPDKVDQDSSKAAASAESEEEEEEEEEEVEPEPPISPFDLPGDWYVIHSYSGYEKKVKLNLETRALSMHMDDRIFEVVIPMETVIEIKGGRKVEVPKKMFPGYILVRMYLDDDTWYAVRNTPGVTAFVGSGIKPTPLSRREVERFLGVKQEAEKKVPRFKPLWDIGEVVRVVDGPFADFNGVIEDINIDQQKVRVLVEIFGRDTPMELNFEQIQKQ